MILFLTTKAQVVLPYYSGFDNATQQAGWTEYKNAATIYSHWVIASASEYSAPNCLTHDFSPSSGILLTDNWYVSPAFSITGGGNLDSIRYKFSGFSVPLPGDTIAIYLINGSQDPNLASSKHLLFDFRNTNYIADNIYRILTNIALPALSGNSYIAIRYRNTNCSSNWLTVFFDNIAISGSTVGITPLNNQARAVNIYPNPLSSEATVSGINLSGSTIDIYNSLGIQVRQIKNIEGQVFKFNREDLSNGIYYIKLSKNGEIFSSRKLIITD